MEMRSVRRRGSPGAGADRLSALPDDLLLLVLARLPCASAAARTGVLASRWRGLWSSLRRVVLCEVAFPSLEAALARVSRPPHAVALLQIDVPKQDQHLPKHEQGMLDAAGVNSLLLAAARLEPVELVFAPKSILVHGRIVLPRFHRTTSITLDMVSFLYLPPGAEFPALETLSLQRCIIFHLNAFIPNCLRLRTIRLHGLCSYDGELRFNSESLQQIVVERRSLTTHVNIIAPMLKELTMSINTLGVSISVLAPMVEKVSWRCSYTEGSIKIAHWRLHKLMLHTAEAHGQLPSLHIHACISSSISQDEASNFTREIEKHFIAPFSALELHLGAKGHAYGPFVFHVLRINRIRCATQRLKIDLQGYVMEKEEEFLGHCSCDSRNWKSQTISLRALEEVEISGFDEKDHDFNLLERILICAPMLQRMVMKLSQEASASEDGCAKIYDIFTAYPSVECYVYLSSGSMHGSRNCPST